MSLIYRSSKDSISLLSDQLLKKGVMVNIHYIPVYRHKYYSSLGFEEGYCQEAESYFNETISLPIYPNLKKRDFKFIVHSIKEFFNICD